MRFVECRTQFERFGESGCGGKVQGDVDYDGAGTQEVAEFIMLSAEAIRRVMILEAAHTSDASLDVAVILFEPIVQVGTRPVQGEGDDVAWQPGPVQHPIATFVEHSNHNPSAY